MRKFGIQKKRTFEDGTNRVSLNISNKLLICVK